MKRVWAVLIIFAFLFMNFVSAYYACSEDSRLREDTREIAIGETKIINGVTLGLTKSDEIPAIKRLEADLLVDAQSATLKDNTSKSIIFMDGENSSISLLSSTESDANVQIDSDNKILGEKELGMIGGFDVFLLSAEGNYPGTATVKVLVGKDHVSLSNTDNPAETMTVEKKEYGLELFSASDSNALIKVSKCYNEGSKLIWIENKSATPEKNTTVNNSTNETQGNLNATNNDTLVNNTTINATNIYGNNSQGTVQENKTATDEFPVTFFYIAIGVMIIVVLAFIIWRLRSRKLENSVAGESSLK